MEQTTRKKKMKLTVVHALPTLFGLKQAGIIYGMVKKIRKKKPNELNH